MPRTSNLTSANKNLFFIKPVALKLSGHKSCTQIAKWDFNFQLKYIAGIALVIGDGAKTKIASKKSIGSIVDHLKFLLEKKNFFAPKEKRQSMITNINNLFYRFEPSDKELRILASIISTLAKNSKKT